MWKLVLNRQFIGTTLFKWGVIPSAVCTGCIDGSIESENHLLLHCDIASNIWSWLLEALSVDFTRFRDVLELIKWASKQKADSAIGQLRLSCTFHALWTIWCVRNNLVFDKIIISKELSVAMLRRAIYASGFFIRGKSRIIKVRSSFVDSSR